MCWKEGGKQWGSVEFLVSKVVVFRWDGFLQSWRRAGLDLSKPINCVDVMELKKIMLRADERLTFLECAGRIILGQIGILVLLAIPKWRHQKPPIQPQTAPVLVRIICIFVPSPCDQHICVLAASRIPIPPGFLFPNYQLVQLIPFHHIVSISDQALSIYHPNFYQANHSTRNLRIVVTQTNFVVCMSQCVFQITAVPTDHIS